ncbi:hypothetical protein C8Q80DRAFT_1269250 [Daedaleopsis nitida]|nr:hypothetical protein C8Q80DRAFT_1269250 [Daedaleopsis nitida]
MAGEMLDISFAAHMEHLAPFSPSEQLIDKCLAQLEEAKLETEAFRPLSDICDSMCKVTGIHRKDVRSTTKALASFLFATEEELGYSQSIRCCPNKEDDKTTYCLVYQVSGRFFKTIETISEYLSLCATGRATRVFKVLEVHGFDNLRPVEDAQTRVLKHAWLDEQAKTEGDILATIFERLDTLRHTEKLKKRVQLMGDKEAEANERSRIEDEVRNGKYKKYFLTVECHERGQPSKSLPEGASPYPKIFSSSAPKFKPAKMIRSGGLSTSALPPPSTATSKRGRTYAPKTPYFVVSKEVCMALHQVDSLHTVIHATQDCFRVIIFLNLIGWAHRDICSGNLFWDPEAKHDNGILSDLEYAKDVQDTQGGGTLFFMAAEIMKGFSFAPRKMTLSQTHNRLNNRGLCDISSP